MLAPAESRALLSEDDCEMGSTKLDSASPNGALHSVTYDSFAAFFVPNSNGRKASQGLGKSDVHVDNKGTTDIKYNDNEDTKEKESLLFSTKGDKQSKGRLRSKNHAMENLLLSSRAWHVKIPAKSNQYTPTFLKSTKKAKIVFEIYRRPCPPDQTASQGVKDTDIGSSNANGDNDVAILTILSRRRRLHHDQSDSGSSSGSSSSSSSSSRSGSTIEEAYLAMDDDDEELDFLDGSAPVDVIENDKSSISRVSLPDDFSTSSKKEHAGMKEKMKDFLHLSTRKHNDTTNPEVSRSAGSHTLKSKLFVSRDQAECTTRKYKHVGNVLDSSENCIGQSFHDESLSVSTLGADGTPLRETSSPSKREKLKLKIYNLGRKKKRNDNDKDSSSSSSNGSHTDSDGENQRSENIYSSAQHIVVASPKTESISAPLLDLNLSSQKDKTGKATSVDNVQISSIKSNITDISKESQDDAYSWHTDYILPMRCVALERCPKKNNSLILTTNYQHKKKIRRIIFGSDDQATDFYDLITARKKTEEDQIHRNLQLTLGEGGTKQISPKDQIHILVEIVSAQDLQRGDIVSADPYVVVRMGDSEIHRTQYLKKSLNPIWTILNDSLFLLTSTIKDLFGCFEGICFEVMDFDAVGTHESLGIVYVPPKVIHDGKGERMEYDLKTRPGAKAITEQGKLVLRFRHASKDDISFMKNFNKRESPFLSQFSSFLTPDSARETAGQLLKRNRFTNTHGIKKFRVRPGPDPERPKDTEWLTKDQIAAEHMKPSTSWIECGSGKAGRIFLEILGCDNLPNMDVGPGNFTDAFVCSVFEDTYVVTDVIDDCLAPRWMPWSRRAFVFNIHHPSSPLYLGVFDYDSISVENHDAIGRITVDVSSLPSNTECILKYDLYTSARVIKRQKYGTITFRIRLEDDDPRENLLSGLELPPEVFINCKTKKEFALLKFTCDGKYDRHQFSLKIITSYIEELTSYEVFYLYAKEAVQNHFLWRGGMIVSIPCLSCGRVIWREVKFPIASLLTFLAGVTAVENPNYIPSFYFAFWSWMMLEALAHRKRNPSPWRQPKSFFELLKVLIVGKQIPPKTIEENEGSEEIEEYKAFWEEKIKLAREKADVEAERRRIQQEEYEKQAPEITAVTADEVLDSYGRSFNVDPLKPVLFPLQIYMAMVIDFVRVSRNVVMWEEPYYAFWVTVASMLLSFGCLFIPWGFMIKWGARLTAWLFLGPWMRLVDIYYLKPYDDLSQEERKMRDEQALAKQFEEARRRARIQRENYEKLFDMKKYQFGKFIMKVPVVRHDRHIDFPLTCSTATPYDATEHFDDSLGPWKAIPGQRLVGDMIPKQLHEEMDSQVTSPLTF